MEHDPYCTDCEHDCVWRTIRIELRALGAPYCPYCDDHSEAIHAGLGDQPCDCPDDHDD